MLGEEVVFDVDEFAFLVDPLECVAAVAVVVGPAIRSTVVGEEHHTCVVGFGCEGEEIKEGVVVEEEVLGAAGLGADDIWALNWVSAEEDGLLVVRTSRFVWLGMLTQLSPTMS